jgi:hypothetical protein
MGEERGAHGYTLAGQGKEQSDLGDHAATYIVNTILIKALTLTCTIRCTE